MNAPKKTFALEIERVGELHERSVWTLYAKDPETGERRQIGKPYKGFCMAEPAGAAAAFEEIVSEIADEAIGRKFAG